jgi:ornithine cyclodeaminase/alanine dehydrogenase
MKPVELIYLSHVDIVSLNMSMGEAITIVENVLREHGRGHFENPPKPGIHPQQDAFIHAMPGYLPRQKAAGLKWVSGFPGNYRYKLPSIMGLMILNDVKTGQPTAVMDCSWITQIRTGAVSAVATKYLARKAAKTIGIVGAGVQGRANALALSEILPSLRQIKVFDVNADILKGYISDIRQKLSMDIEAANSAKDAIEGADIIVTATGKLSRPIFKKAWVKKGALILPVHTRGWEKDTLQRVDKFVVDHWEQFRLAQQREGGYYKKLPELYAELGEIVCGKKPGRQNEEERIMDHNYGMAIHDVAMAQELLLRANKKRIGIVLPLIKGK